MAIQGSILDKWHNSFNTSSKNSESKPSTTEEKKSVKNSVPNEKREPIKKNEAPAFVKAHYNPYNEVMEEVHKKKVAAQQEEWAFRSEKVDRFDTSYKTLLDLLFRYTAAGNFGNQEELFFSRTDRFGNSLLTPNVEHSGITFFTRPKLPFTPGNIAQCPTLASFNTLNPMSRAFAIRCWLDTHFTGNNPGTERLETALVNPAYQKAISECPYFDQSSAFIIPLGNACISQSGWPDPFIQTFTTTGGYFCEDQTFPIGSDRLRKTYDIQFTFREGPGAPILALLYAWYEAMACLTEGTMIAYSEDIDAQRMCYTCSIYRFLLDPSKTHITHYAKATGCFPKAPPLGALFNQSKGEINIQAANEISIPFVCNKVEYDDPRILLDFNFVVTKYCPAISSYPVLRPEPYNNFKGYPFVISTAKGLELAFREPAIRAYTDDQSGKMPATTRERYELQQYFYPEAYNSLNKGSGDKPEALNIARGPESRFLYRTRVVEDGKDIQYYESKSDDFQQDNPVTEKAKASGNVFIDDPSLIPINADIGKTGYMGEVEITASGTNDMRSVISNFSSSDPTGKTKKKYAVKHDDSVPVNQFDPIFVNSDEVGFDIGSRNRGNEVVNVGPKVAPLYINTGNRDFVDSGNNPNTSTTGTKKPVVKI